MKNKIEKWLEKLTLPYFYIVVFLITSLLSLIGYSCVGQDVYGHYNTLVDLCSEKEHSVASKVSISSDSVLSIENLVTGNSFFYNLKNKSKNISLEKKGYKEYLGFTDRVALNHKNKSIMIMNSSGCVYVFLYKTEKPKPPSQYNRRG